MSIAASGQGGSMVSEAEVDLARRLRAGCPEAFASLQQRYLDVVHGYVVRRVGDLHAAEDIVCEVFEAAAGAARSYRGRGGLYAWLLGIASRKVVDWQRRECRRLDRPAAGSLPDATEQTGPAQFLEQDELHRAVRAAIAGLPAAEREALLLQVGDGLSLAEIGAVMRRSPNAVKCLHHRARERLRATLAPLLDDETGGGR